MYCVNFQTGAGNYESDLPLGELKAEVEDKVRCTGLGVYIEDAYTGEVVAYLPWYSGEPEADAYVTRRFGSAGYYGEWANY